MFARNLINKSRFVSSAHQFITKVKTDPVQRCFYHPKAGVEKVVWHKDIIQKHRKSLQEEQLKKEQEEQDEKGFSAEKVAAIIVDQQKDLQQAMREADVSDMPLMGIPNPYEKPHEKCILCQHSIEVDYKNIRLLSQFISPHTGQIYGRHVTGLCMFMQKRVAKLIKRARYFGFLPHINKDPAFLRDPKLFDPFKRKY